MLRKLILALALLVCASSPSWAVNCAVSNGTCFWIGGTGTMDFSTDSGHWSNSTGGTTCTCEPIASNTLTFDASSGGGTVTIGATVNVATINQSGHTGAIVNPTPFNVTLSGASGYLCTSGTTASLTMGNGATWKFTGARGAGSGLVTWNTSGTCLTLTSTGSTIEFAASAPNTAFEFRGNSLSYNNIQVDAQAGAQVFFNGNLTAATLSFTCPTNILVSNAITLTLTTLSPSGCTGTNYLGLIGSSVPSATSTVALTNPATITNASILQMKFSGATLTANSSYDLGGNTGTITINAPVAGSGGGFIIGGG